MDPIHKKVLAIKTATIMNGVTNPLGIASYLSTLFCSSDKEEIEAVQRNLGPTHAAQKLLSLLEKRGPKAFDMFIKALKDPDNVLHHLAEELQEEERKLRGGQGALRLPTPESPVPPSTSENFNDSLEGQKDDYSLPPSTASTIQFTHEESDSKLNNLSRGQDQASPRKSSTNNVISLETLIKDIPYSLCLKIEKLMDPLDANHHDWRGIASVMHLSADDVRQLEIAQENGKMKGLIEKMIRLKKTINDLLGWLKDPNVARWDVIDKIKQYPNNIPSDLLSPATESSEDQLLAPLEIIFRGPSAVSAYHKALSEGKTTVKRVPIMFIGQGQSGKTSLKGSLKGERFNAEETTTKGIETDPSYCKVSRDVWKIGDSGDEAITSDPGPISYVQRTARCILKSLKEDINVDNPTYSKDSQEFWKNGGVQETNSDHADATHNSSREIGVTGDDVGTKPDQSEPKGLPDELVTALVETWRQQQEADGVQDEDLYSILWDFGGQSVYYATHPIFLTRRAMYLLVYNLSRDPNGKVSPQVKRGFYEDIEDVFCERSDMDYLDLWMSSVSSLVLADEDFHELPASDLLPERLPPVFLVCTQMV